MIVSNSHNTWFVFQYVVFLSSYSWIIAFSCTVRKKGWIFYDESLYQVEISPLICRANQWTGLYMVGTSAMKDLITFSIFAKTSMSVLYAVISYSSHENSGSPFASTLRINLTHSVAYL